MLLQSKHTSSLGLSILLRYWCMRLITHTTMVMVQVMNKTTATTAVLITHNQTFRGEGQGESWEGSGGGSKVFRDWVWRVGGMDQTALPSSSLTCVRPPCQDGFPVVRCESFRLCRQDLRRETSFICNICSAFSFRLLQKQRIESQIKLWPIFSIQLIN